FKPGLSATVDIHTQKDNGLSVPIQAVTTREINAQGESTPPDEVSASTPGPPDGNTEAKNDNNSTAPVNASLKECVFVYRNGKVYQVNVTTGIQDDQYIRIMSGLEEGDEVVISPFTAISKTLKNETVVEKVSKDQLF